jgi:hypothetical protein
MHHVKVRLVFIFLVPLPPPPNLKTANCKVDMKFKNALLAVEKP